MLSSLLLFFVVTVIVIDVLIVVIVSIAIVIVIVIVVVVIVTLRDPTESPRLLWSLGFSIGVDFQRQESKPP